MPEVDIHQAKPTLSMLSTRRGPPCAYPLKPTLIIQLLKRLWRVPFLWSKTVAIFQSSLIYLFREEIAVVYNAKWKWLSGTQDLCLVSLLMMWHENYIHIKISSTPCILGFFRFSVQKHKIYISYSLNNESLFLLSLLYSFFSFSPWVRF